MSEYRVIFENLDTALKYFYIYIFCLLCLIISLIAAIVIKFKKKKTEPENKKYVPKGISIAVIIVLLAILSAPLFYFIIMG